MLVLLLRVGERHFGLDARVVVEVTPCVPLRPAANAPVWMAGWLHHRDGMVPVVDLSHLLDGAPADRLLSTRLVLLRRTEDAAGDLIALLAEGATAMTRLDGAASGASTRLDDGTDIQLVQWTDLVPAALCASLPSVAP